MGERLRGLRVRRGLPLREVAPAAAIDTALLSKIEKGVRLPTQHQIAALAAFFGQPVEFLEALRLAEKFWRENAENPAAPHAAVLIEETAAAYGVNKPMKNPANELEKRSASKHRPAPSERGRPGAKRPAI